MKQRSIFFTLFLFIAACTQAAGISYHFWKGKINGVEVKMACAVNDEVMTGEIFQYIDGEGIICNVAGAKNGSMYDIKAYREIEGEGIVFTHFLRAEIKKGELIGITQNDGKKFKLKEYHDPYAGSLDRQWGIYNSPYVEGKTFNLSGWNNGGEYLYANHMDVHGELTMWYKPDQEAFTLSIRRDSEANGGGNDALIDLSGIKPAEDGSFDATLLDCGYHFSVKFYDHFLVIRQLMGTPSKCFGSGAGIVGIYVEVPAKG